MLYDFRRAAGSKIADTTISSSAPLYAAKRSSPWRTVSGEPTMEHASMLSAICFSAGDLLDDSRSADERHATIEKLEAAGVTWLTIAPEGKDRTEYMDRARAFAGEFITP